jgi:hypothetical protein
VLAVLELLLLGHPLLGQSNDSTLVRIARLVSRGDRQGAHAAADSLLATTPTESGAYVEGLYWRAFAAANAADAERDYLRVAIEYPLSPRAEDALLLLSQLEFARGDRASALRHLDRLVRDHPNGPNVGRAAFWTARIAFDTGDTQRGCTALATARTQLAAEDVETRNQVEYFIPRCTAGPTSRAESVASPVLVPRAPTTGRVFSLQVAAFKTNREAQALTTRLKKRGFDIRVIHLDTWYRVRIGRYATRADALTALARARASKVITQIVEAEPR